MSFAGEMSSRPASCGLVGFRGAGDVRGPLKVGRPRLIEETHKLCRRRSAAISPVILHFLEEIALAEGAVGNREVCHPFMRGERFCECDEGVSLVHAPN